MKRSNEYIELLIADDRVSFFPTLLYRLTGLLFRSTTTTTVADQKPKKKDETVFPNIQLESLSGRNVYSLGKAREKSTGR